MARAPMMNPDDAARKAAARAALQAPSMPAEAQAIHDHNALAAQRAEREAAEAAQTAAPIRTDDLPEGWVKARVTRKGDGKIFTGQIDGRNHDAEGKFTKWKFGHVVGMEPDVAIAQEDNGHVEVLPEFRARLGLPLEEA